MRVVLQRVKSASVTVDDQVIGKVGKGYMLLVGFTHDDSIEDIDYIARKVANARLFADENGKINLSIKQVQGAIYRYRNLLCMPQPRTATGQALGQRKSQNWPRKIIITLMKNSGHTELKFKPVNLEPIWT